MRAQDVQNHVKVTYNKSKTVSLAEKNTIAFFDKLQLMYNQGTAMYVLRAEAVTTMQTVVTDLVACKAAYALVATLKHFLSYELELSGV